MATGPIIRLTEEYKKTIGSKIADLWVYNSYYRLAEPRSDDYIVRLVSASIKVNFQRVGSDLQKEEKLF